MQSVSADFACFRSQLKENTRLRRSLAGEQFYRATAAAFRAKVQ